MRQPVMWAAAAFLITPWALAQGVSIPYFESFEGPAWPGPEWTITLSAPAFGRVVTAAQSPVSPDGGLAASFDVVTSPNVSTNELTLAIDLAAAPGAVLRYWAKETADETDPEDGLFLNDGISATWFKVVDHATLTASWVEIAVGLAQAAAANGLALTPNFKVRFSQRDNFPTPTDGLQIDGVRIVEPVLGQANSAAAFLDLNDGINGSGQATAIGNPGPFFANVTQGGILVFDVQGPPNVPWLLLMGPLNANNAIIPGVGSLDVGLLGLANPVDIAIVLDGTQPGFLNALARTDPTGRSVLTGSMPPAPIGPWFAFQVALVNGPAITLSAATLVTRS